MQAERTFDNLEHINVKVTNVTPYPVDGTVEIKMCIRDRSFTIKNTSGDDTKTARTIVAAFDENNVMLGIESKLYRLSAAVTDKITINEVNNAAFYRILILNADDNLSLIHIYNG